MSGKIYTPQDIHALIERAAKSHDELAKSVPGGTDRVKAEALRRWAAVYIPVSAEPQGAPSVISDAEFAGWQRAVGIKDPAVVLVTDTVRRVVAQQEPRGTQGAPPEQGPCLCTKPGDRCISLNCRRHDR